MNTKNIKAVIFDMDGTLIDTEKYYRMFWPKALAHFGYVMTDEQALYHAVTWAAICTTAFKRNVS